jgi:hypothetical protein
MARAQVLRAAAIVVFAGGGLFWMNSFAPLQWPTVLVYAGLAILAGGILSMLLPRPWSGFSKRVHGLAAGILLGGALIAAGLFWPAGSFKTAWPGCRLDAFMPAYNFRERHVITIQAPAERVRQTLNRISFADIGVMQTLGRIRSMAMGRGGAQGSVLSMPILEVVQHPRSGFFPLDDTPREFVFGLAGQPWNNIAVRLKPEEFAAWAPAGNVKIAANFLIEDAGEGRTRVITETRVAASDEAARRKMASYWALIYPGSGMIRRNMLQVIRERAEHP